MFCQIREIIENYDFIVLALRILGINLRASENERIFKYPALFLVPAMISISINFLSLYYSLMNVQDFGKIVHCVYMFVQGLLVLLKIFTFLKNARKFQKLINHIKSLVAIANLAEYRIWQQAYRQQQRIICFYLLMCVITGVVYGLSPVLSGVYSYVKSNEYKLGSPYWALFPINIHPKTYVNNAFRYLLFIPLAWSFLPSSFAIDSLYCWYIFTICAHYRILKEKLRILAKIMISKNTDLIELKVRELINYHCDIIEMIDEFQAIFQSVLFAEVVFCAFLICLLMSQVGIVVKVTDLPFICLFMGAVTTQLAIFCLGGQKLKNHSHDLNASMFIPWDDLPCKSRKDWLLPIMRSQREATLLGYFFTVDSPLLVWIFKTAWTFSAFLMVLKEQNE